jgi:hypothetical protein
MTTWTIDEPITIEKPEASEILLLRADEPSHIHIPRPSRLVRPATAAPVTDSRRSFMEYATVDVP